MRYSYRSPKLLSGFFNGMGSAHIHIDGAQNEDLILDIIKTLEKKGNLGKLNYVYDSIAGPQRKELLDVYGSHTPVLEGKEALDFFSTNLVKNREDGVEIINSLVPLLSSTKKGLIVEMEQVVGRYDFYWKKFFEYIPLNHCIAQILPDEVRFHPEPTLKYEIHHGFEVIKQPEENIPSVSLEILLKFCEENNIAIGGWFIFEKEKTWAYRSNSFHSEKDLHKDVMHEHEILYNFWATLPAPCISFRTIVENVIGIWKT